MSGTARLTPQDYTVGWLCALPKSELVAAIKMLDQRHDPIPLNVYDENTYMYGSINHHNVVIACLPPGQPGKVSASRLVHPLSQSFPNIKIHLFVGIGGGVPRRPPPENAEEDIHLGDVVVGWAEQTGVPAVVQYDLIRREEDEKVHLLGTLDKPHRRLLNALGILLANHISQETKFEQHLERIRGLKGFSYPGLERDKLYKPTYRHDDGPDCSLCDPSHLVERKPRENKDLIFHQGTILSGDMVMKNAQLRDEISQAFYNAHCFEMEAAGVMDDTHCLIIRGIADYSDSHKNQSWQGYAAATAAAFAREFLYTIQPHDIKALEPVEPEFYEYPSYQVPHFVSRLEPLAQIKSYHEDSEKQADEKVVILLGLGGCGKSQLARHYCRQNEGKRFKAIIWVDATSKTTMMEDIKKIAKKLGMHGELKDHDANTRFIKNIMSSRTSPWLLVVDNYDDPTLFRIGDLFPKGQNGSVVVTSRHVSTRHLGREVTLSRMFNKEASRLLLLWSKRLESLKDSVQDTVNAIIRRLDNHALAIAQAGAYIAARNLDFGLFLEAYHDRKEKLMRETPVLWEYQKRLNESDEQTSLSVFTTWDLSLDQIPGNFEERKNKESFLTLSGFFDNREISETLFRNYHDSENSTWMAPFVNNGIWDKHAFQDTLTDLRNLSLLEGITTTTQGSSFSLHPLIQDWIKLRITSDNRQKNTINAILILSDNMGYRGFDVMTLDEKQIMLFHLQVALQNDEEYLIQGSKLGENHMSEATFRFTTFFRKQGWYDQAEELSRRALEGSEKALGKEHPDTLMSVNDLGLKLQDLGKYEAAEQLHRRALNGNEKALGNEHPNTLTSIDNLALVLRRQGKYEMAGQMHRRALEGNEKVLGKEHPDTLTSMNYLAVVLNIEGKYNEAEEMHRQALDLNKKVLGKEHRNTFTSMNNLALVLHNLGKYDEAEEMHRQVLENRIKKLGPEHRFTMTSTANLALVLREQGKYKKAEEMHRQVLNFHEKMLGPTHPDTLSSIHDLAVVLYYQSRYDEAKELYQRALNLREKVLGPEHPKTLADMANLALVYWNQGFFAEAEKLEVQTMEIRKKVQGIEHRETLISMVCLASKYRSRKRLVEAEELEMQIVAIRSRILGIEHPDTLNSMNNLALILWDQGRLTEAERLQIQVSETRKKVLGTEHPDTLTSIDNLALTFKHQGRLTEAERLQVQVLDAMKKVLGTEHPDTLCSMNNLAHTYRRQSRNDEAIELMKDVVDSVTRTLGADHPNTLKAVHSLNTWMGIPGDRRIDWKNAGTSSSNSSSLNPDASLPRS